MKKESRSGFVYSTNPNFKPEDAEDSPTPSIPKDKQQLRIYLDRKNRGGKSVTIVSGFMGPEDELLSLGKTLKNACGVGGNVKEGLILIQGELKEKVFDKLIKEGYIKTKII